MTRPNTPDRVNPNGSRTITSKRACNGCGQLLGDITEQEMARAVNGLPLPDVRSECPTCAPTAPEPASLDWIDERIRRRIDERPLWRMVKQSIAEGGDL